MDDQQAAALLKGLRDYFRAYSDEKPDEMTVSELAGDLINSLLGPAIPEGVDILTAQR